MIKHSIIEKGIIQELKANNANKISDAYAITLMKKTKKMVSLGYHDKAAAKFAALASLDANDFDLPLRAGQAYQKAGLRDDAARWFLECAERYAKQDYPSQAFAAVRLYHSLNPDEHQGPKKIFTILRKHGADTEAILPFLSAQDRAALKLHAHDFFSFFENVAFKTLMEQVIFRQLKNGEVLTRMGDVAKSLYFIVRGSIDGYLALQGKRTHLGTLSDICGETPYFTGGRSATEMIAVGEVELFEFPYTLLDAFKQSSPKFATHLEQLYRSRMLVKQLALSPLFEDIPAELRWRIAEKMTLVSVSAGETLMREGGKTQDLFLVRSGKIAITLVVNNSEQMLKTLETGAVIGEMAASTGKRTATVRTLSDCQLMKLSGADYNFFYQQSPDLQRLVRARKIQQMAELRSLMKGIRVTEGDDTCQLLLKDIWQS